jgi:hypothetical protein
MNNYRVLKKMHAHCETWACRHDVVFASIKYELIHLTRNSKKIDMQTTVRICDVVKQFSSQIRVWEYRLTLSWNEKHTSKTFKTKYYSNVNIVSSHYLHLQCVFCQNAIDLQNDHQINCDVYVNHLTCVVQTFEQRRRHDDETCQDVTTMFANDQR